VGYCYLSGFEKTLCKWDIYVPLVTKGLNDRDLHTGNHGHTQVRVILFSVRRYVECLRSKNVVLVH
jgi:hypothetical protein